MALKCENSVKKALKESRIKRNRELMNKSYKSDLSAGSQNSKPSSSSGFMSGKGSDTLQRLDSRRAAIFSVAKASLYGLSFVFLAPIVLGTLYEWGRAASERARYDLVDAGRGARGAGDRACSLDGNVRDCGCEYFQVDALNEEVVRPSLEAIVRQKYFSFFKVDLHCACPFWPDDSMCSMPACSVCECKDDQLPQHLLSPSTDILECKLPQQGAQSMGRGQDEREVFSEKWESQVDRSIERAGGGDEGGMTWQASDNPWLFNDGQQETKRPAEDEYIYVDLHLNPERFTGYKGEHANRIWKAIYSQSCFKGLTEETTYREGAFPGLMVKSTPSADRMVCKEKEVFFRLISGMHTSITAHIAAGHPRVVCDATRSRQSSNLNLQTTLAPDRKIADPFGGFGVAEGAVGWDPLAMRDEDGCFLDERHWEPNLMLFYNRLGKREHKRRIENLYFVYLFTLQATVKAAPYLMNAEYSTSHEGADRATRAVITSLLRNKRLRRMCTNAFDEGMLWVGPSHRRGEKSGTGKVNLLQEEMQAHFQNISQIMNCVGCEKCKLWGKLQILGLGTALKILFSVENLDQLVLTRNEVIALLNFAARLSEAVHTVGTLLCTLIAEGFQDVIVPSHCRKGRRRAA